MITRRFPRLFALWLLLLAACVAVPAQGSAAAALGSETAKNGFKNEDQIRDKFNAWKTDPDAGEWLKTMGYKPNEVVSVSAVKPHGEKSDVDVTVESKSGKKTEGISIKLVSSPQGFNQIDKRWLAHYAKMWTMPREVEAALKLFCGEVPPTRPGRTSDRMYLDEFPAEQQKAVIDFFAANRERILHDLFRGDGPHAATWFMVAWKPGDKTSWVLKRDEEAIKFFGEGKIEITRGGNLKIGRVTMQRKGGDAGRDTAKMLQFKINPALLFGAK
ncbi:MAG TPA: hypothetical protein VL501_03185 [Pyrinomonadaceae bacterium]|nr:hypothetical protein [Pyrinomonadaceae bacterium]